MSAMAFGIVGLVIAWRVFAKARQRRADPALQAVRLAEAIEFRRQRGVSPGRWQGRRGRM